MPVFETDPFLNNMDIYHENTKEIIKRKVKVNYMQKHHRRL